jgi:hypothetical protein
MRTRLPIELKGESKAVMPALDIGRVIQLANAAKAGNHGLRVDLLFFEHPFFQRIDRDFSAELPYSVGALRTATIEGLTLLKLFALPSLYRQFDLDRADN